MDCFNEYTKKENHKLICVTSQWPKIRCHTLYWLGKHNLNFDEVIFERGRFKWKKNIDWLIDDSPENYKNDACAHPKTREQFRLLTNAGLTDTVKHFIEGKTNWTFWGYRGGGWQKGNGLRIDHFLTSPDITDLIKSVKIDRTPRGWEKASDHTPVILEISK